MAFYTNLCEPSFGKCVESFTKRFEDEEKLLQFDEQNGHRNISLTIL